MMVLNASIIKLQLPSGTCILCVVYKLFSVVVYKTGPKGYQEDIKFN